ncbi:unnamed protein product [Moneuplotes crassus]|uniref:BRO1 domain-containing protein n=1 Tax=Euplotes crassus TaxID=5936 RepID=A0AAD2D8F6_EUPCR|nr:unnamed protein product [Moneuplotes crassus]
MIIRTTEKVILATQIQKYIHKTYGEKVAASIVRKCQTLDEARKELASLKYSNDAQMHKDLLIFYYNGLKYLNSQFSFKLYDEHAVDIGFLWRDSLSGIEYISHQGLDLEMNSILYNLAICIHNMSYNLPVTKESLKTMSLNFQQAAWIFQEVKNNAKNIDPGLRGVDFRLDNLNRLILIELAHSQYCFFKKAELTECKPKLIARIARQTWRYFHNANILVKGTLKLELEKYCNYPLNTIKGYAQIYDGISIMYTAKYLFPKIKQGKTKFSDVYGYCIEASRILSGVSFDNDQVMDGVNIRLQENEVLRKELGQMNDLIYHEIPTKADKLPPIELKNYAVLRSLEDELNKEFIGAWISSEKIKSQNGKDYNYDKYDPSSNDNDNFSSYTSPNSHNYEEEKQEKTTVCSNDNLHSAMSGLTLGNAQPVYPQQRQAVNIANYGAISPNVHGENYRQENTQIHPYYDQNACLIPPSMTSQETTEFSTQGVYPGGELQQSAQTHDRNNGVTQANTQPQIFFKNCPAHEHHNRPSLKEGN